MAEAFVKTMKRDYVRVSPLPDARTVMETLPLWIEHYNSLHPHKALGYRPPASSSRIKPNPDRVRSFGGNNTESSLPVYGSGSCSGSHKGSPKARTRSSIRSPTTAMPSSKLPATHGENSSQSQRQLCQWGCCAGHMKIVYVGRCPDNDLNLIARLLLILRNF